MKCHNTTCTAYSKQHSNHCITHCKISNCDTSMPAPFIALTLSLVSGLRVIGFAGFLPLTVIILLVIGFAAGYGVAMSKELRLIDFKTEHAYFRIDRQHMKLQQCVETCGAWR